jgi:hypothetical protein
MNTKKLITWGLTGLVGILFLGSGAAKLMMIEGSKDAADTLKMGIELSTLKSIAVIEILCAVLFLIPRTGVLGFGLLTAYMGGAIATHLTHGLPVLAPCVILGFVWITTLVRFPEVGQRLFAK